MDAQLQTNEPSVGYALRTGAYLRQVPSSLFQCTEPVLLKIVDRKYEGGIWTFTLSPIMKPVIGGDKNNWSI